MPPRPGLYLVLALRLLLPLPALAQAPRVAVREFMGPGQQRELRLTFPRLPPDPTLAGFSPEEARAFIRALEASFPGPPGGVSFAVAVQGPTSLERTVLGGYLSLYGPLNSERTAAIEHSRWFQALKRSSRYMPEGVRDAAWTLFSAPTVATSLALSMTLYMMAWAAPEPVFSKALAASVTLGLLLTYSAAELHTVGRACLQLYQEAEASRTEEELEAAAERFGRAMGGTGLRILVTVAGAKLSQGLPSMSSGGFWARLSPPRLAFADGGGLGGAIVGEGTRAVVSVAGGTLVLMGAASGTAASAAASTAASTRTTGACREDSDNGAAKRHHIATDKNELSGTSGGPWTPRFLDLFTRAEMSLDDPANLVYLIGHQGPHPQAYHQAVFNRLRAAPGDCQTVGDCRKRLVDELDALAAQICKPDSELNTLTTKKP